MTTENILKKEQFEKLITQVSKFNTLEAAEDCVNNHCVKLNMIVLGDDGLYWVAVPAVTEKLVKAGYEYAE